MINLLYIVGKKINKNKYLQRHTVYTALFEAYPPFTKFIITCTFNQTNPHCMIIQGVRNEWRFLKVFLEIHLPHRQARSFDFKGVALAGIDAANSTYRQFRQFWEDGLNKCKITRIIA